MENDSNKTPLEPSSSFHQKKHLSISLYKTKKPITYNNHNKVVYLIKKLLFFNSKYF